MKMIDISNVNVRADGKQFVINGGDIDALVRAGIGGVFVGMQYPTAAAQRRYGVGPGNAHRNFAALEADGRMRVEGYFESTPPEWAMIDCGQYLHLVRQIGVGIEQGGYETEAEIDPVIDYVKGLGKEPLAYSSAYMWRVLNLLAVTKYADAGIRLWNAYYDGKPDGFTLPAAYGNWTAAYADQFSGSGVIAGFGATQVDLNDVADPAVPLTIVPFTRTLPLDFNETADMFRRIAADVTGIITDNGATAELVVDGSAAPGRRRYVIEVPE